MANNTPRSVWRLIAQNFIQSITPKRKPPSVVKGTDNLGNTYYEIAAEPQKGRRNPQRWFIPQEKTNWLQEVPAEWESWLRGRRKDPPSREEIEYNYALMMKTRQNAKELEEKFSKEATAKQLEGNEMKTTDKDSADKVPFPKYIDYESEPGKDPKEK